MKLVEFFKTYDKEAAKYLLSTKQPVIFILNEKTIDTKFDVSDLTYAQFVAASMLLEKEIHCFDLIRSLILIFNWSDITDRQFNIGNYTDSLNLIDNINVSYAYPIAFNYRKIIKKQVKIHTKELSYIPKAEDKQDGIDMFNKLSFYNSCRAVSVALNVGDPEKVMDWNYSKVFCELLYQKIEAKFNENRTKRINSKTP